MGAAGSGSTEWRRLNENETDQVVLGSWSQLCNEPVTTEWFHKPLSLKRSDHLSINCLENKSLVKINKASLHFSAISGRTWKQKLIIHCISRLFHWDTLKRGNSENIPTFCALTVWKQVHTCPCPLPADDRSLLFPCMVPSNYLIPTPLS